MERETQTRDADAARLAARMTKAEVRQARDVTNGLFLDVDRLLASVATAINASLLPRKKRETLVQSLKTAQATLAKLMEINNEKIWAPAEASAPDARSGDA